MNSHLLTDNNEPNHHDDSLSNDQSKHLRLSSRSSSAKEYSFIPVESTSIDDLQIPPVVSNSMNFSYHKDMASHSRQTNSFVLFRLNQQQIEVERTISLIGKNDYLTDCSKII
ncbi:unnamed protein product [Rotaria sordida]|uniref:Uncharacterized protein n=1 Tax=Rotaria sordida TaxID=392033 RepID=A0A814BBD9_9BILA|nr:unnamed protein product [Rotaria sordida]CAF0978962.1 unnamed protein product [Rotaria sordida]